MKKNDSCIGIAGTIGAVGGAAYAFRHPSEKVCKKIAENGPNIVNTLKAYKDAFTLKNAQAAVKSTELDLDSYTKLKNIVKTISQTLKKEQEVVNIANTPFAQRTKSYKEAVKEANKARSSFRKAMFSFSKELQDKLTKVGAFDPEKFKAVLTETKQRALYAYKELGKGSLKGLAIGAAAGVAVGVALKYILNKSEK